MQNKKTQPIFLGCKIAMQISRAFTLLIFVLTFAISAHAKKVKQQAPASKYKIFTIKGKVVSFDKKMVTLEVDGHEARVARAAFPSSQRLIYNENATAYYRLKLE